MLARVDGDLKSFRLVYVYSRLYLYRYVVPIRIKLCMIVEHGADHLGFATVRNLQSSCHQQVATGWN